MKDNICAAVPDGGNSFKLFRLSDGAEELQLQNYTVRLANNGELAELNGILSQFGTNWVAVPRGEQTTGMEWL